MIPLFMLWFAFFIVVGCIVEEALAAPLQVRMVLACWISFPWSVACVSMVSVYYAFSFVQSEIYCALEKKTLSTKSSVITVLHP